MKSVSVSELKNRLSAYLRLVKAGQTVAVLDRGVPVAHITAPTFSGSKSDEDARLSRLEQAGIIRRASNKLSPKVLEEFLAGPLPTLPHSVSALRVLLDERQDER